MDFDYLSSNWFKLFKKDWFLTILAINLLFNAMLWLLLLLKASPTIESVPLHYSLTFGIDWLGEWQRLFIYPTLGLIMIILNTYLASINYAVNKFLSVLLLVLPLFCHLMLGISVYMLLRNYY